MTKVNVELGENSYEILIGAKVFGDAANFISAANFTNKILIVTDANVFENYVEDFAAALTEHGINFEIAAIPAGEISKTLREAESLYTRAIAARLDRKSVIVALGGGVVGDLAGFVAATYLRGVPFIQIPTTLLAQVDSSVGGKTAVNHTLGKNLIGAFYQPKAVFIGIDTLKTLPERELKAGLGEVVKYGVISDEKFFEYLEENAGEILSRNVEVMTRIVKRCCEIKAEVVSADEKEAGLRRILNFGHTIAHAIEEETGYQKYVHGEAVAIGMIGAALISERLGCVNSATVERLKNLIERLDLKTYCEGCSADKMYEALFRDKKTVGGKINWVLMKSIGSVEITNDVPAEIVRAALSDIIH